VAGILHQEGQYIFKVQGCTEKNAFAPHSLAVYSRHRLKDLPDTFDAFAGIPMTAFCVVSGKEPGFHREALKRRDEGKATYR
jgi:hypothetical protein